MGFNGRGLCADYFCNVSALRDCDTSKTSEKLKGVSGFKRHTQAIDKKLGMELLLALQLPLKQVTRQALTMRVLPVHNQSIAI